jgi:isocitrate/isopropylmalate dehydrogenase
MVRTWAPSLGWLLPVSTIKAPAPALTSAELQQQFKPMAIDLAIVRRGTEQLATNQDQLARKQDQMAQAIATLQGAEQEKILALAPPAPKAVHVSPKPAQPPPQ